MNICLIGMPSSGKSVLGKMLAKKRGMSFLDLDTLIEKNNGKLLREIIAEEGREGFLRIEEEAGASLSVENTVISPGGSICYGERAMKHLREISKVIFLHVPYEERTALYRKYAEFTLEEENLSAEECLEKLMQYLDRI